MEIKKEDLYLLFWFVKICLTMFAKDYACYKRSIRMKKLDQEIATIKDELILMRKDFHRFPEIGF